LRQTTKFMERFSNTLLRDYLGILRDVIAQGQAAGVAPHDINPPLAAKMLFGALDEMATNWMLTHRRSSLDGVADAVVDVFVHGIGAPDTRGGARPSPAPSPSSAPARWAPRSRRMRSMPASTCRCWTSRPMRPA